MVSPAPASTILSSNHFVGADAHITWASAHCCSHLTYIMHTLVQCGCDTLAIVRASWGERVLAQERMWCGC